MRWVDYWNTDTPIYVSERHKALHYGLLARDILGLLAEIAPGPQVRMLDYGCGDALSAGAVAGACSHLTLCDAAPAVRERLEARWSGDARITIASPEDIEAAPAGSFDVVLVNSVLQYLTPEEFDALLGLARAKLAPGGAFVAADVIPPETTTATDVMALLGFAWKGGFTGAALAGLARTAFSDYRRLRGELSLTRCREIEMLDRLERAGFSASRRRPNLGHNQARMTFMARLDPRSPA